MTVPNRPSKPLTYPQREALRKLDGRDEFYRAASGNVLEALERRGLVELTYEWPSYYTLARLTDAGREALRGF